MVQYLPKQIEKRLIIILSSILSFFGFLLVGPSQILLLPDSIILMAIGQAITGALNAIMIIPTLAEMVQS